MPPCCYDYSKTSLGPRIDEEQDCTQDCQHVVIFTLTSFPSFFFFLIPCAVLLGVLGNLVLLLAPWIFLFQFQFQGPKVKDPWCLLSLMTLSCG